jgi:hypothetical protein
MLPYVQPYKNNVVFKHGPLPTTEYLTDDMIMIEDRFVRKTEHAPQQSIILNRLRARNIGKVVFITHMGLGDHFLCNGMIRYYTQFCSYVAVCVKKNNMANVAHMYSDTDQIYVLDIETDASISPNTALYGDQGSTDLRRRLTSLNYHIIACGHHNVYTPSTDDFIHKMYNDAYLDSSIRSLYFKCPRFKEREEFFYEPYKHRNYVVVHESDDFKIDRTLIDTSYEIILFEKHTFPLFDSLTFLEHAQHIHCIDSSILWVLEHFQIGVSKRTYHNYAKEHLKYKIYPYLSKDWIIKM